MFQYQINVQYYKPEFKQKSFAKQSGLRSMQHIKGVEREIIEAYKSELSHDVWGNSDKLLIWVAKKFKELAEKNYTSVMLDDITVNNSRNDVIKKWAEILQHNYFTKSNPFLGLKILKSVTSGLTDNNAQPAPYINKNIIENTIFEIKKSGASFIKRYYANLKAFCVKYGIEAENVSENGIQGVWYSIAVPSHSQSYNISKTKKICDCVAILSQGSNWCTKIPKTVQNIFSGNNIHIFVDNSGEPQLGIFGYDSTKIYRFVCGKNQYTQIPQEYKTILESYIRKHKLESAMCDTNTGTYTNILNLCR